ncbi:hypothetical protein ACFV5N_05990 [Streptomyces sp. NPDC059853]|uniref:hypothetical protein n=1 Tax=Streptomyces sp. NPDC059853 TaxID=3346973 RepID=UPI0036509317
MEILLRIAFAGILLLAMAAAGLLIHLDRANDRSEKEAFEAAAELAQRYVADVVDLAAAEGFPQDAEELDAVSVPATFMHHFSRDGDQAVLVLMVSGSYERAVNPFAGSVTRCFRTVFSGLDGTSGDREMRVDTQSHPMGPCPESWLIPPDQ